MTIEEVDQPGAEWDAFVESTPGATLGHAAAWAGILRRTYGLRPHYLAARSRVGDLCGVLPLVWFRTWRGTRELVSLPFLDLAGVLARDPDVEAALVEAALGAARAGRARALELRQLQPLAKGPGAGVLSRVGLVLPLAPDEETLWKELPAKVRNQTRKASREGLVVASADPATLVREFYGPFAANMRDLGSPVHARGFFESAAAAFGDRVRFVVARLGDRPVGGLVALHYAGGVTVPWASTLRSERARCPNNLIYWEALRWAVERGARELDFGRSPVGSGTHRFKKGWGARERTLAWTRVAPDGRPIPYAGGEAALARVADVWRRLPVGVTTLLGPRLRKLLSN